MSHDFTAVSNQAGPVSAPDEHPFADFVRILGRGPGRSRALTRAEAHRAMAAVLAGEADPHQVGAFLMLLRYRGEDPAEIAGLTDAARQAGAGPVTAADLDWPSYGAGRTRGLPWFLLAALALAACGRRVLMHGSNEFTAGTPVIAALRELGIQPAADRAQAGQMLDRCGFAYLPLAAICPALDRLLRLRALLGLRSPVNTVARLLNPFDAPASVNGVFHPPYVALHLNAAALLRQPRLVVLKGGGGEAERNPAKPVTAHLHRLGEPPVEQLFPVLGAAPEPEARLLPVWRGEDVSGVAIVRATLALALLAIGAAEDAARADVMAETVWQARPAMPPS